MTNVTVKNGNVTIVSVIFDLVNVIFYILPATAGRDLAILGLLGQVAMWAEDQQYVTDIIKNNLEDYDTSFGGWSSLLRKTAEK